MTDRAIRTLQLAFLVLVVSLGPLTGAALWTGAAVQAESLYVVDIDLPSDSTGSPAGTLAVRVHTPAPGNERYPEGAPVLIWVPGGYEMKGINHGLPAHVEDTIIITFLFPGAADAWAGRQSDGTYDYRGSRCIEGLRDVILYAAGELTDDQGRAIDEIVPVNVLHDNIGLEGVSFGGNIIVAVAAIYGDALSGHLRYVVQWETPVSSQIATRDLGRVWLQPPFGQQGDFYNPRYSSYGPMVLGVDCSDLAYDPSGTLRQVFHDGNGDGRYTTVDDPIVHLQTPDLDGDGVLRLNEDFPLDAYPSAEGTKDVYSRAVTNALEDNGVFPNPWPEDVAPPAEADAYWDIRESVMLYQEAMIKMPDLEAMVLAGVRDHVQSAPDKPHIRQAFEGWDNSGAWVQINPSPAYMIEAYPELAGRSGLPYMMPNTPPPDWGNAASYCVPEDIYKSLYQLAAVWEMTDRAQGVFRPVPVGGEYITYVNSEGDNIAVWIEVPAKPRYAQGAPVMVETSTWFTPKQGFHRVNETTEIGAVCVSYMWPERQDPRSGALSEGVYDYGGPQSSRVLCDVIRFASGLIPDIDGRYIGDLVDVTVLTDNVGLWASSHAGVMGTLVLARLGAELPNVKYFVGRENPTRDEMYPLEIGHFDEQRNPVYNPYYTYPDAYSHTELYIDYSTVGWIQNAQYPEGRPFFGVPDGEDYVLDDKGPKMWGNKRYFSRALTQALYDNDAFGGDPWPEDLATVEEVEVWDDRVSVGSYAPLLTSAPDLKVMLVFAQDDHVQAAQDKPHIHQAYHGFHDTAGLWVRMNPDAVYLGQIQSEGPFHLYPDNDANTEPADWSDTQPWGFPSSEWRREEAWLASMAEMADRVQTHNWDPNLDQVLVEYSGTEPTPTPAAPLRLPHDVDRLSNGHTLITDGGRIAVGSEASRAAQSAANHQIIEVDEGGNVAWLFNQGLDFAHNSDRLINGNTLISDTGHDRVLEVDASGVVAWTTDAITLSDGSALSYPNDANWLAGNRVLITDRDNHRVIEIGRDGTIHWQFGETDERGSDAGHLDGPHNADRLGNGNTIIADSNNNRIIEVRPDRSIAWEYQPTGADALSWPRDADRLPNGNTLVTDSRNDRIIEVTLGKQVVWRYGGVDKPYDADRLPNHNTLIADCGSSCAIEVDDSGTVVWRYPPTQPGPTPTPTRLPATRKMLFLPVIVKRD